MHQALPVYYDGNHHCSLIFCFARLFGVWGMRIVNRNRLTHPATHAEYAAASASTAPRTKTPTLARAYSCAGACPDSASRSWAIRGRRRNCRRIAPHIVRHLNFQVRRSKQGGLNRKLRLWNRDLRYGRSQLPPGEFWSCALGWRFRRAISATSSATRLFQPGRYVEEVWGKLQGDNFSLWCRLFVDAQNDIRQQQRRQQNSVKQKRVSERSRLLLIVLPDIANFRRLRCNRDCGRLRLFEQAAYLLSEVIVERGHVRYRKRPLAAVIFLRNGYFRFAAALLDQSPERHQNKWTFNKRRPEISLAGLRPAGISLTWLGSGLKPCG